MISLCVSKTSSLKPRILPFHSIFPFQITAYFQTPILARAGRRSDLLFSLQTP